MHEMTTEQKGSPKQAPTNMGALQVPERSKDCLMSEDANSAIYAEKNWINISPLTQKK